MKADDKTRKTIQKYSYGILLFTGGGDDRKYLLIQNRDTESFIYFFLAWNMEKWSNHYLLKVVRGFSRDELNRLLFYPFDILYTDLYVNHEQGTFQKQYDRAKSNYQYFHGRKDWVRMCMHQHVQTTEIRWGFSKGRIEPNEEPHGCALRELSEEVSIGPENVSMNASLMPVRYQNEKSLFKTIVNVCLFPAECQSLIPIQYQCFKNTIRCMSVSNEILHAKWVGIEEAVFLLPSHLYRILYQFHISSSSTPSPPV